MDPKMDQEIDAVLDSYSPDTGIVGNGQFIDADTYRTDDGESIRILNYDAPEVFHQNVPEKGYDVGGATNTAEVAKLARSRGFTEVYRSGRKDTYGRTLGDLMNPETGEMFSEFLIGNGIQVAQPGASNSAIDANTMFNSRAMSGYNFDADISEAFANVWEANGEMTTRKLALNEADYNPETDSGVAFRHGDRDIYNRALNPMSESVDSALIGMGAAVHGVRQALGFMTGSEELENSGRIGVAKRQLELMRKPEMVVDWQDVNSISNGFQFLMNNAAMSAPYMANTIASAAAGTAVGAGLGSAVPVLGTGAGALIGFGVGLLSPTAIYAGQVYNGQEEKNWKAALASGTAQAMLDRVGIEGGGWLAGKTMKEVMIEAEETLVKRGMTRAAAQAKIAAASRSAMMGYVDDADRIIRSQLGARGVTRTILSRAATSMGSEAVTEAMQETLAYMGENWDEENLGLFDYGKFNEELVNRLTNAAIAGGTLGGAFGAAGGLREVGHWADVAWDNSDAKYSFDDALAAKEDNNVTLEEEMYNMQRSTPANTIDTALRVNAEMERRANLTPSERAMETITSAPLLWRGMTRARLPKDDLLKSHSLRTLGAIVSGNLSRIRSGKSYEESQHFTATRFLNKVGDWRQWTFGMGKNEGDSRKKFSTAMYKAFDDFNEWYDQNSVKGRLKQGVTIDDYNWSQWDHVSTNGFKDTLSKDKGKNMVRQFYESLENMSADMRELENTWWKQNAKHGVDETGREFREVLGNKFNYLHNYAGKFKKLKKDVLAEQRSNFELLLRSEYGLSPEVASDLTSKILDGEPLDGHDDNVFDLLAKGVPATAAKKRTMGLSVNPKFTEYFEQDIFDNIHEAARQAARFTTYHKFIGRDNWRVAQLLDQAGKEGVSQETLNKMAWMMQQYLEANSGNYKRPPRGSHGERLIGAQKFALFWSLLTSLPLSAAASLPELALIGSGLTADQFRKGVHDYAFEFSKGVGRFLSRWSRDFYTGHEMLEGSNYMERVRYLGYMQQEAGAASTVGVSEVKDNKKRMIDRFFKYNGTSDITQTERAMRLAFFNDFVSDHLSTLEYASEGTEAHRHATEQLRNLGIPIEHFKVLWDKKALEPSEQKQLDEWIDLAQYTFINQAIMLPGTANRPLFYQDPRFALFTQFNGYVSTFTATALPRLWNEYIRGGRPSMKYNTFAMMAMMVFLGFASQYLKDWLKYGEPSPYLNDQEKFRRAVNSSGILGQGERVLNFVWPTFESKSDTVLGKGADMVLDEMPAMGPIRRMLKSADAAYMGDYDTAKYQAFRGMPLIGPFTGLAEKASGLDFSEFQTN